MEQDPLLPFFAHCISINAAWAPAKPCGNASSSLPPSVIASLTSGPAHLFSQSPWFWDVISLAPSL